MQTQRNQKCNNAPRGRAVSTLKCVTHVEDEGRALVRCLLVDEDPGGTQRVSHMIQAFGLHTDTPKRPGNKGSQCIISAAARV